MAARGSCAGGCKAPHWSWAIAACLAQGPRSASWSAREVLHVLRAASLRIASSESGLRGLSRCAHRSFARGIARSPWRTSAEARLAAERQGKPSSARRIAQRLRIAPSVIGRSGTCPRTACCPSSAFEAEASCTRVLLAGGLAKDRSRKRSPASRQMGLPHHALWALGPSGSLARGLVVAACGAAAAVWTTWLLGVGRLAKPACPRWSLVLCSRAAVWIFLVCSKIGTIGDFVPTIG
mmetsp:Transcript_139273/g.445226  ORF Transcript_139273/g.445226 Transcript_139273/m.445226 type:complete len:237 (-) Transcript_139273:1866-2576(-)